MLHAFAQWAVRQSDLLAGVAYSAPPGNGMGATCRDEFWEGLPAHCVGRWFSRVEAWHHVGNAAAWQSVLDRYDVHQVVCGYALTGLPQARAGKPYVLWVATSMDGDKRQRLLAGSWLRRLAYRLQARTLRNQERLILNNAAWVMALSPYTRDELIERGAPRDRITVVRCPIDTSLFCPPETYPSVPTVVWSARHADPRKRTPFLLRAFARIWPRLPQARLLLVGEGHETELRRQAAELGIGAAMDFIGPQPLARMPGLLRRGSIFAIPSVQEGLCIAGLEAMACGLPVVSTRCGGPEVFVLPNRTGLLVGLDDEAGFAEALQSLLAEEILRRQLGGAARRFVEEEHGLDVFAHQVRGIYATVWPDLFGDATPRARAGGFERQV
jgi:glycosyltransferase involved in cell wall biosynthesis